MLPVVLGMGILAMGTKVAKEIHDKKQARARKALKSKEAASTLPLEYYVLLQTQQTQINDLNLAYAALTKEIKHMQTRLNAVRIYH